MLVGVSVQVRVLTENNPGFCGETNSEVWWRKNTSPSRWYRLFSFFKGCQLVICSNQCVCGIVGSISQEWRDGVVCMPACRKLNLSVVTYSTPTKTWMEAISTHLHFVPCFVVCRIISTLKYSCSVDYFMWLFPYSMFGLFFGWMVWFLFVVGFVWFGVFFHRGCAVDLGNLLYSCSVIFLLTCIWVFHLFLILLVSPLTQIPAYLTLLLPYICEVGIIICCWLWWEK